MSAKSKKSKISPYDINPEDLKVAKPMRDDGSLDKVFMSFALSREVHRNLKIIATMNESSMIDYIKSLIESDVSMYKNHIQGMRALKKKSRD